MDIITAERFDAYLKNALSPEEKTAFEQQLVLDKDFADAFERHKDACEAVVRAGKARDFSHKIKARLEDEGFFDPYRKAKTTRSNIPAKWASIGVRWAAVALMLIGAVLVFQQYLIQKQIASLHENLIALDPTRQMQRLEDGLLKQDSDIAYIKQLLEKQGSQNRPWDTVDAALKAYGLQSASFGECKLGPNERKRWYNEFVDNENEIMVSAGNDRNRSIWREHFKNKNDAEALRLLRDKAETSPKDMTQLEYYILGALALLYEQNASDAVWYLEKADGVNRSAYAKLRLAAYLDNDQITKARNWSTTRKIPRLEWPKGATRCLK